MEICTSCKRRLCETIGNKYYGKPCKRIEKLLPKTLSGRISKDEKPYSNDDIEQIATMQAFKLKYGRKSPTRPEDYDE